MNFLKIDDETVINLDAIASISAGDRGGQFATVIKYHTSSESGETVEKGLASQEFEGQEGLALFQFLTHPGHCIDLIEWTEHNT